MKKEMWLSATLLRTREFSFRGFTPDDTTTIEITREVIQSKDLFS